MIFLCVAKLYSCGRRLTKVNSDAARSLVREALKIDPNNSEALAGDANAYGLEYPYRSRNSETDYDAKIIGQADRSIALDPDNIRAYVVKGYYLTVFPVQKMHFVLSTPDLPSIQMLRLCMRVEASPRPTWANLTEQNPMYCKRCG